MGGITARAQPEVTATRTSEPPKIDGKLNDTCWKTATVAKNFLQLSPFEGEPAAEKTVVHICFDAENLYIGARCFDTQPDKIRASVMQRDQSVGADDFFFVLLDPYRRKRDGFYFRTNSNGALGEGLLSPTSRRPLMEWDAIWDAASHRDHEGWTTELAIPFRSLSFDDKKGSWGINFGRVQQSRQERTKWTGANRNLNTYGLEETGVVHGLTDLQRGIGIDFKPYIAARYAEEDTEGTNTEFDVGADVFYQITPSLTATFTLNTDFAETEVDERRVNLTRFPLFFPEKRDFFLEGAEQFTFGALTNSPLAFHSRTIGLSDDGERIDILGGAKITGRQGPLGVGVLGMWLDELGDLDSDQVFVGRFTYDVLEESRIGTIFTHGDPRADLDNQVMGADFTFRESHLFGGDKSLTVNTFFMNSDDGDQGSGNSYGVMALMPNKPLSLWAGWRRVEDQFEPGLGFVRRSNTEFFYGESVYEIQPKNRDVIDDYDLGIEWTQFNRLTTGDLESQNTTAFAEVNLRSGEEIGIRGRSSQEVLFEPFDIVESVTIDEGDYRFEQIGAYFESSANSPVIFETGGWYGNYFDGERVTAEAEASIRLSRFWQIDLGTEWSDIALAGGEFDVLVNSLNFRLTPNRRLSWNTVFQYDNLSEQVGINSRVRYILNPGSDLFVVYNRGFDVEDGRFNTFSTEAITKFGWTFRF